MDRNNELCGYYTASLQVALRKESVDRNVRLWVCLRLAPRSLSARRAWIEIYDGWRYLYNKNVALRKESVDRNALAAVLGSIMLGRSPQGERG